MGEVLGLGLTHYPAFSPPDSAMAGVFRWALQDPALPAELKDPGAWPAGIVEEWGTDEGLAGAAAHRKGMEAGFRQVRAALDAFDPDFVVVWGDDQYENFQRDIIPPFAVLAYDDMTVHPWRDVHESSDMQGKPNVWGEGPDFSIQVRGHREGAIEITRGLLDRGFDVAYAYKPLHHPGLAHAFLNTVLFLDLDRRGFPYPLVPFAVNSYGRRVVESKGYLTQLGEVSTPDPPSPSPKRLFALGEAIAELVTESPWRVALIASSSWSHAFLCEKTYHLHPDHPADDALYDALLASDWGRWADTTSAQIEESGQQELLNWFPLAGAMKALGRDVTWSSFVRTWIFNSNKVFTVFAPDGAAA